MGFGGHSLLNNRKTASALPTPNTLTPSPKLMTERIFNFSAGPAVLPVPVLEEARAHMLTLPGVGMSVMEISHRSKAFDEIIQGANAGLRDLLGIPSKSRRPASAP